MSVKYKHLKSSTTNFLVLIKSFLIGIFLAEIFLIAYTFGKRFLALSLMNESHLLDISNEVWFIAIWTCYTLIILIFVLNIKVLERISILVKSFRVDLLVVLFFGAFLIYMLEGFIILYIRNWVVKLSWLELFYLLSLPIVFAFSILLRKTLLKIIIVQDQESYFISDKEISRINDDEFNFSDKAEKFAESVFNRGASESLIFGIDAPWGTGKSSFINLCEEYWNKNHKKEMIIYNFNPLRYEDKDYLMEKFVDGLIEEIKKYIFVPEIESIISKYVKLLKTSNASFLFFGVSFGGSNGRESIDDILNRLEIVLSRINKKILIIVDDLDRLSFSSIKEVLFTIKKAFNLPNISYVLCYDTENITALEQESIATEKISEFLEKFINVKISLYLDSKLLLKYFSYSKEKSLSNNLLSDPILVSKAVSGLKDIFESSDFHNYLSFIGDARKLKRLINTIILLEVEKTDFDNNDFDSQDLIHLLLIYISYPSVFRKIYNTETKGKRGYFSLVTKYEHGYPKDSNLNENDFSYKNSTYYTEYLKSLSQNQQFILNKVFNVKNRLQENDSNYSNTHNFITEEILTTYACFNGSTWGISGRNLERYLELITNMSRPLKTDQHKYFVGLRDEFFTCTKIKNIFLLKEFSFSESEKRHEQLWRVLVNTPKNKFSTEKSKELIYYAINNLSQYSLLEIDNIVCGFGNILPKFIIKLLDEVGWTDKKGKHSSDNTDENVLKIAEWIFGEGENKESILDVLGKEERGIIGLYNLLDFRLYCNTVRGGDTFNLSRALTYHCNQKSLTSGNTRDIAIEEMREMSQNIFQKLKIQYIDKDKNIFDEIDNLTLEGVLGKYFEFVNLKIKSKNIDINLIESKLSILKYKMKVFITYQLRSSSTNNGVCCGYYDISGKDDKNKIGMEVTSYIFNYCFNPDIQLNNYRHFLDFLLANLSSFGVRDTKYLPNINRFTEVLDHDILKSYWKDNSVKIKSHNFISENREIYTGNYFTSYKEDLKNVFQVLDEFIKPVVGERQA